MRNVLVLLMLIAASCFGGCAVTATSGPRTPFAIDDHFSAKPGTLTRGSSIVDGQFKLLVTPSDRGYDLGIYRVGDTEQLDNLLAPSANWHGAMPFQIYAWHNANPSDPTFPNDRTLTARECNIRVHIRITNAKVTGSGPDARFADGNIDITWFRK